MNILIAALAGLVQGLTEFLPVSSSGHLVVLHALTKFSVEDDVTFDVALHLATAIAVVGFFRQELLSLVRAMALAVLRRGPWSPEARFGGLLLAGSVPAALVGALAEDWLAATFRSVGSVAVALAVVALLMIAAERYLRPTRTMDSVKMKDALVIGCAQALALIPGVSRSGITIIAGLRQGLQREAAARFSFLLSVPVVLGAGVKKLSTAGALPLEELFPLAVGFVVALVSGWWAIGFLLRFVKHAPLNIFAYYRLAVAGVLLLLLPWLAPYAP
ncbi:MAG: undecaprenyl-diphosphatase [Parcubacteria group bacterium Gr01-1014_31]|nr:MAG: undecaprenyl-diphosphatase [Parcubacteria group bacterium Gr01-1014_31]